MKSEEEDEEEEDIDMLPAALADYRKKWHAGSLNRWDDWPLQTDPKRFCFTVSLLILETYFEEKFAEWPNEKTRSCRHVEYIKKNLMKGRDCVVIDMKTADLKVHLPRISRLRNKALHPMWIKVTNK